MIPVHKCDISIVIDPTIALESYMPLDLSIDNPAIEKVNANSSAEWEKYINEELHENGKKIAFGGYLEKRNIYQRSAFFNDSKNDRNTHLGVDFWISEGTSIHAFSDGTIHSFQDNLNHGDYGPTIILEHQIDGSFFYSLYGHLSRASIKGIEIGQNIRAGEKIAELGGSQVNGDYAPHLHFQLIIDMEGKSGDYPGVCTESKTSKYKENCPNPLPYLRL